MLGKKKFYFLNEHHEITKKRDWNHSNLTKLWLYNLHYFDDLNAFESDSEESGASDYPCEKRESDSS